MKKQKLLLAIITASTFMSCVGCSSPSPTPVSKTYTVTFNSQGGSEVPKQIITDDALVIKPKDPIKRPYVFNGWYQNSDYSTAFDFSKPITSDITLYAKWEEAIQFTYLYHKDSGNDTIAFDMVGFFLDELTGEYFDVTIDWGDNAIETYKPGDIVPGTFTHKYTSGIDGQTLYKVTVSGLINSFKFEDYPFNAWDGSGNHFVQSVNINELTYADIYCEYLKLGMRNESGERSQVSNITLPNNLQTIPKNTFVDTSIEQFSVGENVAKISDGAFKDLATLKTINFSNAHLLRTIECEVFANCQNLESVVLPENVCIVEDYAFSGCDKLKTVTFTSTMPPLISPNTFDYDEDLEVEDALETIYIPKGRRNVYASQWREYPKLVKKIVELN